MKHVQASAAKTHLPELLDEVERGSTIVITRHGKPIARLVPEESANREKILSAIAEMREERKKGPRATLKEILCVARRRAQLALPFVLDASVTASWYFQDEYDPRADIALGLLAEHRAIVPLHWWFEVGNIVSSEERRSRAGEQYTAGFLDRLDRYPIDVAPLPVRTAVLALARHHRLTFYDAAYLELAKREKVRLASLDNALNAAAHTEGVPLVTA